MLWRAHHVHKRGLHLGAKPKCRHSLARMRIGRRITETRASHLETPRGPPWPSSECKAVGMLRKTILLRHAVQPELGPPKRGRSRNELAGALATGSSNRSSLAFFPKTCRPLMKIARSFTALFSSSYDHLRVLSRCGAGCLSPSAPLKVRTSEPSTLDLAVRSLEYEKSVRPVHFGLIEVLNGPKFTETAPHFPIRRRSSAKQPLVLQEFDVHRGFYFRRNADSNYSRSVLPRTPPSDGH